MLGKKPCSVSSRTGARMSVHFDMSQCTNVYRGYYWSGNIRNVNKISVKLLHCCFLVKSLGDQSYVIKQLYVNW